MSLAASMPSVLRLRSMTLLFSSASRSSADMVQPIAYLLLGVHTAHSLPLRLADGPAGFGSSHWWRLLLDGSRAVVRCAAVGSIGGGVHEPTRRLFWCDSSSARADFSLETRNETRWFTSHNAYTIYCTTSSIQERAFLRANL